MVMLVHIADERASTRIRRAGLVPHRARRGGLWGVFCMPVLRDYYISHQWLRELKRRGVRTMVGVYFRVPDREPVVVGHYNSAPRPMSAARAVRVIMDQEDARGFQIVVPRKIAPRALHKIRHVSQVVGWRYFPDSHGRRPCGCPMCQPRGEIRSRRLREAYEASFGGG
ncbi:MAG: hypothetical protein H6717_09735 [Polyangiaceae bacterium]|nr:hypothetical protein [Polyangiaceae bacterium]